MGETIGNHGIALVSHHHRHLSQTVFGRGLLLQSGEQVVQSRDEFISPALLPLTIIGECLLTFLADGAQTFEKQLTQVIEDLRDLSLD